MNENKIFIGNLPFNTTEELFKEQYSSIDIVSFEIKTIEDGRPSGFGVLIVNSNVEEAINLINGSEINSRLISATKYITY